MGQNLRGDREAPDDTRSVSLIPHPTGHAARACVRFKDAFFFVPLSSKSQETPASVCQDPKHTTRTIHPDSAAPGLQRWGESLGKLQPKT